MSENAKYNINESPEVTSNGLLDVITWLKLGDYVVIHNDFKYGRYFHSKCPNNSDNFIDNHRIIYVNVHHMPGLLDDYEWEWYIKDAGYDECICELKSMMSTSSNKSKYCHFLSY